MIDRPLFYLRRDFAGEMGFDVFLARQRAVPSSKTEAATNIAMGLAKATPKFLIYFTRGDRLCVTGDGSQVYTSPESGLVGDLSRKVADGVVGHPHYNAASRSMLDPLCIEASDDGSPHGSPQFVLLHNTRTSAAYLLAAQDALQIVRAHLSRTAC